MKRVVLTTMIASLAGIAAVNQSQRSPAGGQPELVQASMLASSDNNEVQLTSTDAPNSSTRTLPDLVDDGEPVETSAPPGGVGETSAPQESNIHHATLADANSIAADSEPVTIQLGPGYGSTAEDQQAYVAVLLRDLEWRLEREESDGSGRSDGSSQVTHETDRSKFAAGDQQTKGTVVPASAVIVDTAPGATPQARPAAAELVANEPNSGPPVEPRENKPNGDGAATEDEQTEPRDTGNGTSIEQVLAEIEDLEGRLRQLKSEAKTPTSN